MSQLAPGALVSLNTRRRRHLDGVLGKTCSLNPAGFSSEERAEEEEALPVTQELQTADVNTSVHQGKHLEL